jgi:hypothetical protein
MALVGSHGSGATINEETVSLLWGAMIWPEADLFKSDPRRGVQSAEVCSTTRVKSATVFSLMVHARKPAGDRRHGSRRLVARRLGRHCPRTPPAQRSATPRFRKVCGISGHFEAPAPTRLQAVAPKVPSTSLSDFPRARFGAKITDPCARASSISRCPAATARRRPRDSLRPWHPQQLFQGISPDPQRRGGEDP